MEFKNVAASIVISASALFAVAKIVTNMKPCISIILSFAFLILQLLFCFYYCCCCCYCYFAANGVVGVAAVAAAAAAAIVVSESPHHSHKALIQCYEVNSTKPLKKDVMVKSKSGRYDRIANF
uniref:Transmembrane protein n=1 Tax=Glossina austeni TaxID=7395 RepID=A0A1A9UI46_GLOAU